MSTPPTSQQTVYWPQVKAILDSIMDRWKARWGREPLPGIHEYYWATPQQLQASVLSGHRAIEPGVPGKDTNLVRSLARGVRGTGRMPLKGPFLTQEELNAIIAWIDNGMPEAPP
ncbi:MAG: cytochrome c [SAR202 cluster bacterium]|nr:cytochrome c [SAR202 cluster bacterium]